MRNWCGLSTVAEARQKRKHYWNAPQGPHGARRNPVSYVFTDVFRGLPSRSDPSLPAGPGFALHEEDAVKDRSVRDIAARSRPRPTETALGLL